MFELETASRSLREADAATVHVVDDDSAVRASLCWLIETVGLTAKAYNTADEFLRDFNPDQVGCVVVDVRLPGMSGLDLQDQLGRRGIRIPIIVITGHGEVSMAVRAMKAGALNFLEKPFSDQQLLDEIHKAIALDRRNRKEALRRQDVQTRLSRLTPREREVMDLVVNGMANKQIAAELGLSDKTVEIHRARVMDKTGADSLAALVRLAMQACETGPSAPL
jgi:FixJ family two-component response regulator